MCTVEAKKLEERECKLVKDVTKLAMGVEDLTEGEDYLHDCSSQHHTAHDVLEKTEKEINKLAIIASSKAWKCTQE